MVETRAFLPLASFRNARPSAHLFGLAGAPRTRIGPPVEPFRMRWMPLLHGLHGPFAWTALGQVAAISLSRAAPWLWAVQAGTGPGRWMTMRGIPRSAFQTWTARPISLCPRPKNLCQAPCASAAGVRCTLGGLCGVDTRQSPGIGAPLKGPAVGSVCPLRCRGARQIDGR